MGDEIEDLRGEVAKFRSLLAMMNKAYISLQQRGNRERESFDETAKGLDAELSASVGRVAELDRQLAEAEAVIMLAKHHLGVAHPVWWVLDGYDGSGDAVRELKELCDSGAAGFEFDMTRGARTHG